MVADKYIGQLKTVVSWFGVDPNICTLKFNKAFNSCNIVDVDGSALTQSFNIQDLKIAGMTSDCFDGNFECNLKDYVFEYAEQKFTREEQNAIQEIDKMFNWNTFVQDYSYFKLCYAHTYRYCDMVRFYDNNSMQVHYLNIKRGSVLNDLQPFYFFKEPLCRESIESLIEKENNKIV